MSVSTDVTTISAQEIREFNEALESRRENLCLRVFGDYAEFHYGTVCFDLPELGSGHVRELLERTDNAWVYEALTRPVFSNATAKRRKHVETALNLVELALRSGSLYEEIGEIRSKYYDEFLKAVIRGPYQARLLAPHRPVPWTIKDCEYVERMLIAVRNELAKHDTYEAQSSPTKRHGASPERAKKLAARAEANRAMARSGGSGRKG